MSAPTQTSSRDLMASVRRVFSSRDSHMTLILILAIVVATVLIPRFSQPRTLTFLTLDVTATLLMALPMTLVMINADIDLSVASTAGLVSASFGVLVQAGVGFWASIAICLLIGLACGLVNAIMTAYVGLPALAVTIGTLALYRGLALVVIGDQSISDFPKWATSAVTGSFGSTGIPYMAIPVIAFVILFWLLLHKTPYGRGLFALGYSKQAAEFVGIDTKRSRVIALTLSGLMAALAGIYASWQRTPNEGKRHAQVHGFRKIRDADLFVTVDSDSMLDAEALHEIVQPFSDPRVMSVAGVILAINNRENLLARVTDVIFVGQQLIDRSFMSQLGSVMVNSGGLAAYRCSILAENIDTYLNESYLGRHVEFSDDSLLTLFALLHGRTVQQPSAFAFAWMPDRWSHHYRQQERWFRGSFIRGLWRIRFLPVLSWGWWRQATGWMQIWLVISVFVYLLLWRPLVLGGGVPPTVVLVPLAIGLAQGSRYISVWRSDTTGPQRYASLLLSPVATLWSALILRPLRVWGMVTSAKMGWNTRQQVEVTSQ